MSAQRADDRPVAAARDRARAAGDPARDHRRRLRVRDHRRAGRVGRAARRDGALRQPGGGDGRDRRLAGGLGARGRRPRASPRWTTRRSGARTRRCCCSPRRRAGRRSASTTTSRARASSLTIRDWEKQPVDPRGAADAQRLPDDRAGALLHDLDRLQRRRRGVRAADRAARPRASAARTARSTCGSIHRGAPRPDRSPNAFDDVGPYGAAGQTIVQYWFFYAFDDWISPVIAGQLRQYHEADWEAVTIGFSQVGAAVRRLLPALRRRVVPVGGRPRDGRTRTVVAVAEGSQANYRFPNPSQAPDWTGCANLPARTTTLVSYASNIRDRTSADWSWSPPADGFEFVDARDFPMNVVARWAPYSRTELQTLHKTHPLGGDAARAGHPEHPAALARADADDLHRHHLAPRQRVGEPAPLVVHGVSSHGLGADATGSAARAVSSSLRARADADVGIGCGLNRASSNSSVRVVSERSGMPCSRSTRVRYSRGASGDPPAELSRREDLLHPRVCLDHRRARVGRFAQRFQRGIEHSPRRLCVGLGIRGRWLDHGGLRRRRLAAAPAPPVASTSGEAVSGAIAGVAARARRPRRAARRGRPRP